MKCILPIFILFYLKSSAQTDTLTNAKAFRTNFIWGNTYGIGTNANVYGTAWTLNFDGSNNPLDVTMHRIDLTTHATLTKTITGIQSQPYMFWRSAFDSSGNLYYGFNSTRHVVKFWLKDSIRYKDFGNSSTYGDGLAYTIQLATDKNIYIGNSSSATSTDWAWVDTQADTMYKQTEIDDQEGYNLGVMGGTTWVASQVGQNPYKIYSVRKSDNYKKLLATQSSLFNTAVRTTGNFFQQSGTWYKVTDTTLTAFPGGLTGGEVAYTEVNVDFVQKVGAPIITNAFFDAVKSKQYWKLNNVSDSIDITSSYTQTTIRRIYSDYTNNNRLLYVGEYYGNLYDYGVSGNTTTALGFIGFNIFYMLQYDDTTYYICGYPSAQLAKWVTTQAWTAETFYDGVVHHLSSTTNPQLIGYWRSNTTAGFHEPNKLVKHPNGIISSGGNVIRTDQTSSIGCYNPATNQMWGFNQDSINRLNYSDIAAWGNNLIFSTNNSGNIGTPKLFIYNTTAHTMTDSLNFSFNSYGNIYIIGDLLLGIAQETAGTARFYKINLSTKQLVYNKVVNGIINFSQWMPDAYIGINTTALTLPTDFFQFRTIGATGYTYHGSGNYFTLYNNQGLTYQVLNKTGVSTYTVDIESAQGKQKMLQQWLH